MFLLQKRQGLKLAQQILSLRSGWPEICATLIRLAKNVSNTGPLAENGLVGRNRPQHWSPKPKTGHSTGPRQNAANVHRV